MNPLARARRCVQRLHLLQALLLAALLLAAQGLGLAHHALHGHGGQAQASAWLDGHGDGSADCRLIDQLGHADAALGASAGLPAAPLGATAAATPTAPAPQRAPARRYQARAPPQAETARA